MGKRNQSEAQLANLEKGKATQFRGETAVKAQQRAAEVQREKGMIRRAVLGKLEADPERLEKIANRLLDDSGDGNVSMMKLLLELLGEKENEKLELVGIQDLKVNLTVKD